MTVLERIGYQKIKKGSSKIDEALEYQFAKMTFLIVLLKIKHKAKGSWSEKENKTEVKTFVSFFVVLRTN